MGRPIKKKFFANLNDSFQDQATGGTTGYGGEGVASYGTIVAGSGWSATPTVTVSPPDFAFDGAATATVQVHYKALTATTVPPAAKGSGYQIGDLLVQHNGATGTYAVWQVTKLRVVDVIISNQPASQNFDGGENLVWDSGVDDNWTSPTILFSVASTGNPNYDLGNGDRPYNVSSSTYGVWDGTVGGFPTLAPASLSITGGNNTPNNTDPSYNTRGNGDLRGHTGAPSVDNNGSGGTANFTYGIEELALVSAGDYTDFTSGAKTLDYSTGSGGTGATANIAYGLLSVDVLTPGRGYTSNTDALLGFSGGTGASATAVLTQAYDNGLRVTAYVVGGSSGVLGDIMKQEASHRYLVKTAQGQSQCTLVTTSTLTAGTMNLIATDSLNSTYFVTKLTAHRANLTQYTDGGSGFEYGVTDVAGWTINSATTGTVSISNV